MATPDAIAEAGQILQAGGLVALPTETVYGLGADATSDRAVAGIFAAKGRPAFNPLISHIATLEDALREGVFSLVAMALARAFWPGPLTLVVPARPDTQVCSLARAGLETLGLRIPAHKVALALIEAAGRPIAAPSANRSGHVSPVTAAHVRHDLDSAIDMILDDGPCMRGLESTIIACIGEDVELLRPGALARADVERVLAGLKGGPVLVQRAHKILSAPGMMASHYAPNARLRLNAAEVQEDEMVLDFAGQLAGYATTHIYRDLSPEADLVEAAASLFRHLRELDACGGKTLAVASVPHHGLGEAINDRLARAAAPRGAV